MNQSFDTLRLKTLFRIFLGFLRKTIWYFQRVKNQECSTNKNLVWKYFGGKKHFMFFVWHCLEIV